MEDLIGTAGDCYLHNVSVTTVSFLLSDISLLPICTIENQTRMECMASHGERKCSVLADGDFDEMTMRHIGLENGAGYFYASSHQEYPDAFAKSGEKGVAVGAQVVLDDVAVTDTELS